MDKEKLRKLIPLVVLVIAVGFTLYAVSVLQDVENQCNTHLKEQYESFVDQSCDICTGDNRLSITLVSIDVPLGLG